jgi:hypothetical protein
MRSMFAKNRPKYSRRRPPLSSWRCRCWGLDVVVKSLTRSEARAEFKKLLDADGVDVFKLRRVPLSAIIERL